MESRHFLLHPPASLRRSSIENRQDKNAEENAEQRTRRDKPKGHVPT
jgi:hypothetical protein